MFRKKETPLSSLDSKKVEIKEDKSLATKTSYNIGDLVNHHFKRNYSKSYYFHPSVIHCFGKDLYAIGIETMDCRNEGRSSTSMPVFIRDTDKI